MIAIFKYNCNACYLTNDMKSGYAGDDFSISEVYLNEKQSSEYI